MVNAALADRVKDLTNVGGVRGNQLVGYGLVVGLAGTGDGKDPTFTGQSLKAILESLGVTTNPYDDYDLAQSRGRPIQVDNVAAVMVTATLPPFAKPGQVVDVNVAALGTATSLRGGNLVMTELRGIDGQTYAVAQGPLTVTGVMEEQNGTSVQIGIPTSGRVPDGATVERQVDNSFDKSDHLIFNVNANDFSTTAAITEKINEVFGEGTAFALDGVSLAVRAPVGLSERVSFVGMIENLEVEPGVPAAKVVINSRTGTVVINQQVKISAAAVSHGTVSVSVSTLNEVSQPGPLTEGPGVETRDVANSTVEVNESSQTGMIEDTVDLRDIVDAIQQVAHLLVAIAVLGRSKRRKPESRASGDLMDAVVSSYNDFQELAKLRAKAEKDQMSAVREVGQQFEAFFIQMMLKSMRDAGEGLKSGLWESGAGDSYEEMFDAELSTSSRSLGIGDWLVSNLIQVAWPQHGRAWGECISIARLCALNQASIDG